jgi:hypothetical protein
MPAVNTPQFSWVKSRMPCKPQPVPPIFQPEVAADAIYFAAHHRRREMWVGGPTVKAIVADKVAPGLVDHYLAENGYDSQQTDMPEDPNRPCNLWQPLDAEGGGDFGAHGEFDARANDSSLALTLAKARPWLQAGAAACAAIAGTVAVARMLNGSPGNSDAPRNGAC